MNSKEEERVNCFAPSSTSVVGRLEQLNLNAQAQSVCVRDEVDMRYSFIITHAFWLKLCGHRHTTVPGDINEQHGEAVCFGVVVASGRSGC